MSKYFILLLPLFLIACSSIKDSPKYQLSNGQYKLRQPGTKYTKVFVTVVDDTTRIFMEDGTKRPFIPEPLKDQFFLKPSFDVDVITVPFKFRPITSGLPRQLTTDFNGNLFIGYRRDHFRLRFRQTAAGPIKTYRHRALSAGVFGGIGSTSVTPWTTNSQTTDEYNGFVFSRGLALMAGINNLTVGIGVGWDYLTDRDKSIWIYQNKPWYGLTLGLNIN